MPLLSKRMGDWGTIYKNFVWDIPEYFNIADAVCDRHARERNRVALYYESDNGKEESYTFAELQEKANRLANAFLGLGLNRGDRVGIILPQRPETAIAHLAIYKIGAIAIPLANLFGPEALQYRLSNSSVKAVIIDDKNLPKIQQIRDELPDLAHIILVSGRPERDEIEFAKIITQASSDFKTIRTKADEPVIIIYTSGTTGQPKGALHAHRYIIGHLPGFELSHNFFPQKGDLGWTPADWAWIGGLMDLLMPCWFYGQPVLAYQEQKFDPEKALAIMQKYRVRNVFMPPTALKMIRQVPHIMERFDINLRTIMCGGEALGSDTLEWAKRVLDVGINEIYGQTEANYIIGNCQEILEVVPGSMGKPYPGHIVEIMDDEGQLLSAGEVGEIVFRKDNDPVFFLEYWNDSAGTKEKFKGEWACSGDLGVKNKEGRFWFIGRKDDVIISSGYRIGPTEIEESLIKHPAVALSAVIGIPDEIRGSIVKAFVKLVDGYQASAELAREIQKFVKSNLAAHEYPRELEFVKEIPMTTTGKIKRKDLRLSEEERRMSSFDVGRPE